MLRISVDETPCFLAKKISGFDDFLIALIFAQVSLWSGCLIPVRVRPFTEQSTMLSLYDPRKRCEGRTHARLSHLWRTHVPDGIGPTFTCHETLCAKCGCPVASAMFPYPLFAIYPLHIQQPRPLAKRTRNLSSRGILGLDMIDRIVLESAFLPACYRINNHVTSKLRF